MQDVKPVEVPECLREDHWRALEIRRKSKLLFYLQCLALGTSILLALLDQTTGSFVLIVFYLSAIVAARWSTRRDRQFVRMLDQPNRWKLARVATLSADSVNASIRTLKEHPDIPDADAIHSELGKLRDRTQRLVTDAEHLCVFASLQESIPGFCRHASMKPLLAQFRTEVSGALLDGSAARISAVCDLLIKEFDEAVQPLNSGLKKIQPAPEPAT